MISVELGQGIEFKSKCNNTTTPTAKVFIEEDQAVYSAFSSVIFTSINPSHDNPTTQTVLKPTNGLKAGDKIKLSNSSYPTVEFTIIEIQQKAGEDALAINTPYIEGGGLPDAQKATRTEHNLIVKTTGSEFNGLDISDNNTANYIHNFIINGTISFNISAAGGSSTVVSSDIFTPVEVLEIQSLVGGKMDAVTGYFINEYQLLHKLIIWGYIDNSYIRTVRPYVTYNNNQNTNDGTTALNYKIPCTTITSNNTNLSITTDAGSIIWEDGSVTNNNFTENQISGNGNGNVYIFGNYTKFEAINQDINSISNLNNQLKDLDLSDNSISVISIDSLTLLESLNLSNNALLNITSVNPFTLLTHLYLQNTNSSISDVTANTLLTELDLSNTNCLISDVTANTLLTELDLSNTNCLISDVTANTLLTELDVSDTNSSISDVTANVNLVQLKFIRTNCYLSDVTANTLLTHLYLQNTNSSISDITANVNLLILTLQDTNCSISDFSANTNIRTIFIHNTNCILSSVSSNNDLKSIKTQGSNTTPANTNNTLQDLIADSRTGTRNFTFDHDAAIDQAKVNTLVQNGWDITQV